jgi:hypothetical protein
LWNPHADITGPEQLVPNGKVDIRDISPVARHFEEYYPQPRTFALSFPCFILG